jgi:hypothetical protein
LRAELGDVVRSVVPKNCWTMTLGLRDDRVTAMSDSAREAGDRRYKATHW